MKTHDSSNNTWLGAGIGAAVLAAICCITPVFAVLAGVGGIASTFAWLEPMRPWMIGFTILFIGLAWYQHLRSRKEMDCECEEDPPFFKTKRFLGIVTVVVGLLIAFPWYAHVFVTDNSAEVVYVSEENVQQATFTIDGMTCTGCEASVRNAAQEVEGVVKTEVSYHDHHAVITYDKTLTDADILTKAINSTGFTVDGVRIETDR